MLLKNRVERVLTRPLDSLRETVDRLLDLLKASADERESDERDDEEGPAHRSAAFPFAVSETFAPPRRFGPRVTIPRFSSRRSAAHNSS